MPDPIAKLRKEGWRLRYDQRIGFVIAVRGDDRFGVCAMRPIQESEQVGTAIAAFLNGESDVRKKIANEAKQCQTAIGAAILCAVAAWIETGDPHVEGDSTLHAAIDGFAGVESVNAKLLQLCRDLVEDAERAASPSARQYKYEELKAAIAEAEG